MRRRSFIRGGIVAAATPSLLWDGLLRPAPARGAGWSGPPAGRLRDGPIRLTQNENPLGMPPGVLRAVTEAAAEGHRYPRLGQQLVRAVAARNGLDPATVMLGNGSTEILRVAVHAAAARGPVRMVLPDPTYEAVGRFAVPWAADVVRIPLAPDRGHDLDAMRAAAAAGAGPVFIFVCNPNNPTGGTSSCDDVEAWIRDAPDHHFFLVDEAYYEFAETPGYRTLAPIAVTRPNVLVSRTFSKIYGMAGLRLGYGIGEPATIRRMQAFTSGLNINHLAHAAGLAALEDDDYIRRSLASNREALRIATSALDELGLEWLPTQTNFVMHRVAGDLEAYIGHMRDAGILVGRPFPPLLSWNRVSLGTPDEMGVWAETLRGFRRRGWA